MNALSLQRQLRWHLQQLGIIGGLGLLMLLLAVLAWFALVRAGRNETDGVQRKLAALTQQAAGKSGLVSSPELDREEQLRVFYQRFGKPADVPDSLRRIYKAAIKQGLELESGEYALLQNSSERLARVRVTLPVKGSFRQVLGFMDAVLQDNPTVALENAAFKRDKISDETVEAKLVYLVFVDTLR